MDIQFPVRFEKMSGTGNDFVIIDNRDDSIRHGDQSTFAARVCRRMFSVGADGLILIEHSAVADFKWQFYNADGSVGEMCGNGSRCVARFAYQHGIADRKMTFETLAGIIEAEIIGSDGDVRVLFTAPHDFRLDLALDLDGRPCNVSFVNTGVPHAIVFMEEKDVPVKKWGRMIRYHQLFQPAGTNADFVWLEEDGAITVRTYERGVEDETMACGTGAVASAILAALQRGLASPVTVLTSGGDRLEVHFELAAGSEIGKVYLQGPARCIYAGELAAESLL
ncbi:MAG: diaminopimelate epimerase [Desulfopila sp.]